MTQDPSGGADCILDSTTYGNHGTPIGGWNSNDLVDGKVHKCLDFREAHDINCGSNSSLDDILDLTVEAIINYDDYGESSYGRIVSKSHSASIFGWNFFIGGTGQLLVQSHWSTIAQWSTTSTDIISANTDYYVAMAHNNNSNVYDPNIYVNDSLYSVTEDVSPSSPRDSDAGQDLYIGSRGGANTHFDGRIEEVRISNNVRTDDWLKTSYYSNWDKLVVLEEVRSYNWLDDWGNRVKITIDSDKINETLYDFPLFVNLSDSSGIGNGGLSYIVETLASGTTKLAITGADGVTQLPVEVSYWNNDPFTFDPDGASLCVSGTSDASDSYSSGYLPEYAFDGSLSTRWASLISLDTHWIGYEFEEAKILGAVKIYQYSLYATDITVQGTNDVDINWDDRNWDTITTIDNIGVDAANTWKFYATPNFISYKTIRLVGDTTNDPSGIWSIFGIEFIEKNVSQDIEAELWTSVPLISSLEDTILYLYYDPTQSDNTSYVGETGSVPAKDVWSNNFLAVYHLSQYASGGVNCMLDSTSNSLHQTPYSMDDSNNVDGVMGKAIDFDGTGEYLYKQDGADGLGSTTNVTVDVVFKGYVNNGGLFSLTSSLGGANAEFLVITYVDSIYLLMDDNVFSQSVPYTEKTSWHTLSAIYDGVSGKLIMDNTELIDSPYTATLDFSSHYIATGVYYNSSYDWVGQIDDLRISSVSRSAAWVNASQYNDFDNLVTFGTEEEQPTHYYDGYITENTLPVERPVKLYRRSNGALINSTTSAASDGYYYLTTTYNEEHFIIAFDDASGEDYNALILDKLDPTGIV
jgi:hypothetical protein